MGEIRDSEALFPLYVPENALKAGRAPCVGAGIGHQAHSEACSRSFGEATSRKMGEIRDSEALFTPYVLENALKAGHALCIGAGIGHQALSEACSRSFVEAMSRKRGEIRDSEALFPPYVPENPLKTGRAPCVGAGIGHQVHSEACSRSFGEATSRKMGEIRDSEAFFLPYVPENALKTGRAPCVGVGIGHQTHLGACSRSFGEAMSRKRGKIRDVCDAAGGARGG